MRLLTIEKDRIHMDKDVLLVILSALIPSALGLVGVIYTAYAKEKSAKVRIHDAAKEAAQEAARETAKLQLDQHDQVQEDLTAARLEIGNMYNRLNAANTQIDTLYDKIAGMRRNADKWRMQLIEAGLVPIPWED